MASMMDRVRFREWTEAPQPTHPRDVL